MPARVGEPAVVVGEVDEAGLGVGPPAAHDVALGAGVGPEARALGGHQAAAHEPAVGAEPVALQPVAERVGDDPARGEAPVVVGEPLARGRGERAAQHGAVREGVVGPAVSRVAGHRRVGRGVHPVALQTAAVGGRHVPARVGEPAVVVGQVDEPGLGVPPLPAHDVALGAGVGPPAGALGGHQPAAHEPAVRAEPVALQAVVEGGGDRPARGEQPVVVREPLLPALLGGAAQHVAVREGVVVPAVLRVAGLRRVRRGVHPVALEPAAVGAGDDPARVLEPAVVVREVDEAARGVDPLPAHDVALGAGVGPPARVRGVDERRRPQDAVGAHPVALQAVALVGVGDEPAGVSGAVGVHVVGAALPGVPSGGLGHRRLRAGGQLGLRVGLGLHVGLGLGLALGGLRLVLGLRLRLALRPRLGLGLRLGLALPLRLLLVLGRARERRGRQGRRLGECLVRERLGRADRHEPQRRDGEHRRPRERERRAAHQLLGPSNILHAAFLFCVRCRFS